MGRQHSMGDEENWKVVEQRLLRGDRVRKIAEDEGVNKYTFSDQFRSRYGLSHTAWAVKKNPALKNKRGFRGGLAHAVNEHYFDNFFEDTTEHAAYVFGILYGRPVVQKKDCFEFASGYETLVDIVRREFEWEHKPHQDRAGVYLLRFRAVAHLYKTLISLGFGVKVKERLFPEIDESVLSHFMRGIVEANSGIGSSPHHPGHVTFWRFGNPFLTAMNSRLQHYAGVQKKQVSDTARTNALTYSKEDGRRINSYIYQDPEGYLEDTGLYVPEIRDRWFRVGAASGSSISDIVKL